MYPLEDQLSIQNKIKKIIETDAVPTKEFLTKILEDKNSINTNELLNITNIARKKHHDNKVKIHILNNVQNGHCSEDCSYCAQRKNSKQKVPQYAQKSDEEIIAEAKVAYENGAFRYCMVTSGRGLTDKSTNQFASLIKKIKAKYPLEICLSAGLVDKPEHAKTLFLSGLNKYNHNLNTAESQYNSICTTHSYNDRLKTLDILTKAGVSLCSGVIVGMGESHSDLAEVALTLRKKEVHSIPINFFLPVPDHSINNAKKLDSDFCLRVLSIFRLANPSSEIRMAAGREIHLNSRQADALKVADSLFVSGYLNAHGSNTQETIQMIYSAGFRIDAKNSDLPDQLQTFIKKIIRNKDSINFENPKLKMKSMQELRPQQLKS